VTLLAAPPRSLRVLLVGNPNVGKSSLINALAGSNLSVGNWPGTTVDRLSVKLHLQNHSLDLIDLPGTYSLAGATSEETITRHELCTTVPDLIMNIVDAGNLERNLCLTLELSELGQPMVVVLNLTDEAASKGIVVDPGKLSEQLGVPVVATVANRNRGIAELRLLMESALLGASPIKSPPSQVVYPADIEQAIHRLEAPNRWLGVTWLSEDIVDLTPSAAALDLRPGLEHDTDPFLAVAEARITRSHQICQHSSQFEKRSPSLSDRLDQLFLHRVVGIPLFLVGMLVVFRFTYLLSKPWIDYFDVLKEVLGGWVASCHLPPLVESFFTHGVIDGAGTVLAFSPVLFTLYLATSFLESSGLMARTAFLCDKLMGAVKLPGRALIPLLLGFGCNVPAIYATRALPAFGDRLRVAMALPFMACSARMTVFVLFTAVFFRQNAPTVVFGLYLLGLLLGLGTALLLSKFTHEDSDSTGVMELPPYRFPTVGAVSRQAWLRTRSFIRGAGGSIMIAVLVVWALHSLPLGPPENSYYARVSRSLTVAMHPIGVGDWRLTGALIPGFIAKEVVIGTLGVSYLGSEVTPALDFRTGIEKLASGLWLAAKTTVTSTPQIFGLPSNQLPEVEAPNGLQAALGKAILPGAALAYLVFVLLYTPCVATVAAIAQEFGNRWAAFSVVYQLTVAYVAAMICHAIYP
jgi:ferrous iron transport protein B